MDPILYVEDEEDYRILVCRILQRAALPVETVETAGETLTRLRRSRPPLLILDINLPDSDGYAVCREIRRDPAWLDLPVLMLTVRRRPEEWLRGFSCGADDYLSKPLEPAAFLERVQHILHRRPRTFCERAAPEYRLVRAAVEGNHSAFEILMRKYRDRLIDNLMQMVREPVEAEEICSRTFIRAFESLSQFRGEASFYTWLYRIAANEAYQSKRPAHLSLENLMSRPESEDQPMPVLADSAVDELCARDATARMGALLDKLPSPYGQMLEMFGLQRLSYAAISRQLGIPLGTVMSRMFKARRLLRQACAGWKSDGPA